MRPLLVIILIVAALGAFYVAFSGDSTETQTQGLTPDSRPTPTAGPTDDAQLVGPDAIQDDRTAQPRVELEQPQAVDDRRGFKNRLTGRVVDEDNNPIADASVVLTKWGRSTFFFTEDDGTWDRSDDRKARTNEEGVYEFDNLPAFEGFALIANHEDFGATEVGEVSMDETGLVEEPPIVLHPGFKVWGVITDTGSNIVPGASIVLSLPNLGSDPQDGPETKRLTADATGGYEIKSVGPGLYALTVTADGYGRVIIQKVQVEEGQDLELNVELAVAQMIAGRVTSPGGAVVAGAKVQAYSMPGRGKMSRSQTRADENGEFRFEDIPAGSYTIMASQHGYNHKRKQRIETGTMSLNIELDPLPSVNGNVVDAATGKPVPGCRVRLRQAGSPGEVSMPVSGTNGKAKGPEAAFSVNPPSPGKYLAEASSPAYATCFSEPFSIAQGQTLSDIVVRMTRGGKITGRVVDSNGKGVGGVTIETQDNDWTDDQFMRVLGDMYPTNATTRQVTSKANGDFIVANLTPATYLLQVKHAAHTTATKRNVRVVEGQDSSAGDIQVERGAEVSGTVYGPSGKPLPGSVVQLTMQPLADQFPTRYSAKTDREGGFRFEHVRQGSYTIKATRSAVAGSDPFQALGDMKASQRPIEVQEGEKHTGIDLTLDARG